MPSPSGAAALAAAYLDRAGTHAASRFLGEAVAPSDGVVLEAVRDQLVSGAALCDGLLAIAAEGGGQP